MNIRLIIKDKQNIVLQTAIFHESETLSEFLAMIAANSTFGKPSYDEVVSPEQRIEHEDGSIEIIPAVIVSHESEYFVEQVDVTDELQRQKESNEAKAYLLATDYKVIKAMETGIPMNEQVKILRAEARLKVI